MTEEERVFIRGQWRALDEVLSALNGIDTEGLTGDQVRKKLYHLVMGLRPILKYRVKLKS